MDYTTLTLAEVRAHLDEIARDAQQTFGHLNARQLNWRPDETRWGVAQCFEHLLTTNRMMLDAARAALDPAAPRTIWQRLPVLPGMFGRLMIRSLTPTATRKLTAPGAARPAASHVADDVVRRFADQQREAAAWIGGLEAARAARTIMASPFLRVITYSVLDACRLIAAHDRRHLEQARRVMQMPAFPAPGGSA
ncbi:MAG TPA: DinB family protein [Vicinamibacterales bacterium]|nr:DinB family protein [Vicinamibacterales bacterium]